MTEDDDRRDASLTQLLRMFGHHREEGVEPEQPETQIGDMHTDEELEAELAALEAGFEAAECGDTSGFEEILDDIEPGEGDDT